MPALPFQRASSLEALRTDHFDLVVIGAGITGAGVALDAASRGLRTALVERHDIASGTSSKSSKLVHGGLRYLQQGEVGLVYQALAERQRLLRNAPHLVRPLPFLIPMFGHDGVIPAKISRILGLAMWGYDLTGGYRIGKLHRRVTKAEALEFLPTLPQSKLVSGYLYYDAAADDARLTLTVARTAAHSYGATVATRLEVVGIGRDAAGRADSVTVRDLDGGDDITIATRAVVNAGGVWADDVRALDEGTHPNSIRPAKGIHITVPHHLVPATIAAVIPVPKDRRSIFVVPQGDVTYIGTTDTDYQGSVDDPQCSDEDVAYLLDAINASSTTKLSVSDIVGTWAGLRPLVKSASSGRTADLSRRHRVAASHSGVITVTGGKLTTYREMAADTVDEVVRDVLRDAAPPGASKCRTRKLRLRGADGYDSVALAAAGFPHTPASSVQHLAERYGGEARAVMSLIETDPTLAEPLVAGLPYLRAEALYAARYEMALSVDDVLSRRTRARLWARDAAAAAADDVAALIGPELGWSSEQAAASAEEFRGLCEHERTAAHLPHSEPAEARS